MTQPENINKHVFERYWFWTIKIIFKPHNPRYFYYYYFINLELSNFTLYLFDKISGKLLNCKSKRDLNPYCNSALQIY